MLKMSLEYIVKAIHQNNEQKIYFFSFFITDSPASVGSSQYGHAAKGGQSRFGGR